MMSQKMATFQMSDNECYSARNPVASNVLTAKAPASVKNKMTCFTITIVMATILNFLLVLGFCATLFYFHTNLTAEVSQLRQGQNGIAGNLL